MKAKIVNLDGNYSQPLETDDGSTKNVAEYFEYHREYQPESLEIGSIVDVITMMGNGGYPDECILISSDEPNSYGRKDWYLGLLPSNLEMLGKTPKKTMEKTSRSGGSRSRGMVKPYKDAKEQAFSESGLPDTDKEDYDKGWDDQMDKQDQLESMSEQEYERQLGEATEIINFNGQMTLFENPEHNGKMTDYVLGQIMNGYAPPYLGIGYEVNIVDWVQNPDPENFVIISSKDLVPAEMAAPMIIAAKGHWCLFMRKENLKMFLPPDVVVEQNLAINDNSLSGEIAEVEYSGYTAMGDKVKQTVRGGMFTGREKLCVNIKTGEEAMMETPPKGWMVCEEVKLLGDRMMSTISALTEWFNKSGITITSSNTTSVSVETAKSKSLGKAIDRWDIFYVEVDGDSLMVSY